MFVVENETGSLTLYPEDGSEMNELANILQEMKLGDQLCLEAIGEQDGMPIIQAKNTSGLISILITSQNPASLAGLRKLDQECGEYWQFIGSEEMPEGSFGEFGVAISKSPVLL